MHGLPGSRGAGRGNGFRTHAVFHVVRRRRPINVRVHTDRYLAAGIQVKRLPRFRRIDHDRAVSAHTRHHGFDNVERRRDRHCSVKRIASGSENLETCLRRNRMRGRDHSLAVDICLMR